MLKSQEVRKLAPEMDPLRMGMGWKEEDLTKPQILIESTYGQSHPGSAHLLNLAGGVMDAGPNLLTLEQIGKYSAMYERGEITEEQFTYYKHHACPSCGACSFMGTASTMQIMAESLGLMLPGTALMPATCEDLSVAAEEAGNHGTRGHLRLHKHADAPARHRA